MGVGRPPEKIADDVIRLDTAALFDVAQHRSRKRRARRREYREAAFIAASRGAKPFAAAMALHSLSNPAGMFVRIGGQRYLRPLRA